jgi:hypothetical protein
MPNFAYMQSLEPPYPGATKTGHRADPHQGVLDPYNAGVFWAATPNLHDTLKNAFTHLV